MRFAGANRRETLKRYPWSRPPASVVAAPHLFLMDTGTSHRKERSPLIPKPPIGITGPGTAVGLVVAGIYGLLPLHSNTAALGIVTIAADYLLDYCQTPDTHPWPRFLISAPTKGKAYSKASVHGFIQLDIAAWVGSGFVAAYKLTGNPRYWEAACHWADELAAHCDLHEGKSRLPRYANSEDAPWKDNTQTGGVVFILRFLDTVIQSGYAGHDNALIECQGRRQALPARSTASTMGRRFDLWPSFLGLGQSCRHLHVAQ